MNGERADCELLGRFSRRAVLWGFALVVFPAGARARSYRDFAQSLLDNLPDGARFRPDLEDEILRLANGYRSAKGIGGLERDAVFHAAARAQAVDMMVNGFIGHRASDGTPFERRLKAFGGNIQRFGTVGENAARDSNNTEADDAKAAALFQQWVDSRPHRANLNKGDYAYAATGVVQRGTTIWAIQIFRGVERKGLLFGGATVNGSGVAPSQ
jgi:uncharacterized protein YkwD